VVWVVAAAWVAVAAVCSKIRGRNMKLPVTCEAGFPASFRF